jgi:sialidase-1
VGLGGGLSLAALPGEKRAHPLLEPLFTQTICPWSAAHPRHDHQLIFPLREGRLLFVWCAYYAHRPSLITRKPTTRSGQASDDMPCRIQGRISTDRGRTWSGPFTLQDNLWKRNVKHPNLVRLSTGEILFFLVGWDSQQQRNVFLKRSRDEAETWSDLVQISEPGWYCNNNDHVLTLGSGRILLPAHGVVGGGPYRGGKSKLQAFVYYSDDGFKTWKRSAGSMTAAGRGCHEPSIVELSDGRLLCLLRTTLGRVYQAHSEDGGVHWSKPTATELRAPDSPPLVKRIPGSKLLLVLWNNVESRRNWPRTPLTAAISRDEGKTWENLRDVDARPNHDAAYPSVYFQGEEALIAYYTRPTSWARDSEVVLKGYKIEQLCR